MGSYTLVFSSYADTSKFGARGSLHKRGTPDAILYLKVELGVQRWCTANFAMGEPETDFCLLPVANGIAQLRTTRHPWKRGLILQKHLAKRPAYRKVARAF